MLWLWEFCCVAGIRPDWDGVVADQANPLSARTSQTPTYISRPAISAPTRARIAAVLLWVGGRFIGISGAAAIAAAGPTSYYQGHHPALEGASARPHQLLPQGRDGLLLGSLHRHGADLQPLSRSPQRQALQDREPERCGLGGRQLLDELLQRQVPGVNYVGGRLPNCRRAARPHMASLTACSASGAAS
jgi:hypothetical protein